MTTEAAAQPRAAGAYVPVGPRAGDVWGGIAATLVAFPSSIAFGVAIFAAASPSLAGAGAVAGIVGAAVLGMVAPLVGRNGGFISAPCAPAAAVLSGLAAELASHGDTQPARIVALVALTALAAALLQIVYGTVRAGRLIKFIPYQVVNGYLSGVALIIATSQIPKVLGTRDSSFVNAVMAPSSWSREGIAVGVVTIVAMAIGTRVTKIVPAPIIGLAAGVAAYFGLAQFRPALMRLDGNPLLVGPIHTGGSLIEIIGARATSLFHVSTADMAIIIGPALTLSVLLSIDTLKTGVVLDAITKRRHNSNRELVAQGVANAASFLTGGVPGAGTMGPTLVNVTSGGRSPLSGVIEGVLVLAAFLILRGVMAWLPVPALAGILLVIAWRMFDLQMFRLLTVRSARLDFFVIAAVIVVAEGVGLIQAALVGVFLAILLFIRNQIRGSVVARKLDLRELRSKRRRPPDEVRLLDAHGQDALFVQLQDDLFFGTTDQLFTELENDLASRRFILLDFRRVQSMDYTAAHLITQMQGRLRERRGELLFSGMPSSLPTRQDITDYMSRLGIVGSDAGVRVFETRDSALEWMEDRILEAYDSIPADARPALDLDELTLFRGLGPDEIRELTGAVRERSVAEAETVFTTGDVGDEIFFVRHGRVHILLPLEAGKRHHLATICGGDYFGEVAFLDRGRRSADAVAATETELFVLSRTEFNRVAERNQQLAGRVFEQLAIAIAQRLRVTDGELRALEER